MNATFVFIFFLKIVTQSFSHTRRHTTHSRSLRTGFCNGLDYYHKHTHTHTLFVFILVSEIIKPTLSVFSNTHTPTHTETQTLHRLLLKGPTRKDMLQFK